MDDLVKDFIVEASQSLAQLDGELARLAPGSCDPQRIVAILRVIHAIKGTAGFLGLDRLEVLAHAVEGALERLHHTGISAAAIGLLVEARRRIGEVLAGHPASPDDAALLRRLCADCRDSDAAATEDTPAPPPAPSIRVALAQLDRLSALVDELAALPEAAGAPPQIARLSGAIQRTLAAMRRQRFAEIVAPLARLVGDLGRSLGKEIVLATRGDNFAIDRRIGERLKAPLIQLLRNAADHGIEPAAVRCARGKPPAGTITVAAAERDGALVVTVEDDGSGLPLVAIAERAAARGLADAASLTAMSDETIGRLIFTPGFSTAERVGTISGRGIGLDIVGAEIAALGGSIAVTSRPGRFTRFTMTIPMTIPLTAALARGTAQARRGSAVLASTGSRST